MGLAVFLALHFGANPDLGQAREQFDLVFRPIGYGSIPLLEAVKELSLDPLIDEKRRYEEMTLIQWQTSLIALAIAVFLSIVMLVRALGVTSRWLALAAFAGGAVIVAIPVLGSGPHVELRDAMLPMIAVGLGLAVVLAFRALARNAPIHRRPLRRSCSSACSSAG